MRGPRHQVLLSRLAVCPDGEILETPGEADDAEPAIEVRKRTRLGAYPVHEYGGLIFAYLGPPDEQPPFPEYDASFVPDITMRNYRVDYDCNWLQVLDAIMDPIHTSFLHSQNAGAQFSEGMAEVGELEIFERGLQFVGSNTRRVDDYVWVRVNELILPNFTKPVPPSRQTVPAHIISAEVRSLAGWSGR